VIDHEPRKNQEHDTQHGEHAQRGRRDGHGASRTPAVTNGSPHGHGILGQGRS
jgi:hypothetical protein